MDKKIKSLNQLKKTLKPGMEFEILLHSRPENIGQIRRVTKVNTIGLYSIIPAEPDNKLNAGNSGLGSWLDWDAAMFWTFDAEGVCAKYSNYDSAPNEIIIAFKVLKPCSSCTNAGWETTDKVAACNCCENYEFYSAEKRDING